MGSICACTAPGSQLTGAEVAVAKAPVAQVVHEVGTGDACHDLRDGCALFACAAKVRIRTEIRLMRSGRLHELAHVDNRLLACGVALIVSFLKLGLHFHLDFGFFEFELSFVA